MLICINTGASSASHIVSCSTVMCGRSRVSLQPEEVLAASGMERKQWRDAEQYRPSYKCTTPALLCAFPFLQSLALRMYAHMRTVHVLVNTREHREGRIMKASLLSQWLKRQRCRRVQGLAPCINTV